MQKSSHDITDKRVLFVGVSAVISAGIRNVLLSSLAFALMTACVKALNNYHIPVFEIIVFRSAVSLIICAVAIRKKRISFFGNKKLLLISRGVIGTISLMSIFYAVILLPLAEATILQFTYPIFTAVLAFLFLKEKLYLSTIIAIIVSILGVVVMVAPDLLHPVLARENNLATKGVVIAIIGAFTLAVAYTLIKKLSDTEDSDVIIFYFPLFALPTALILLGSDFVIPSFEALVLLILVGVFAQMSQVTITNAMRELPANKATAYTYTQVIFSILIGWLFFHEVPVIWTYLGAGLVFSGALVNVYKAKNQP